MRVFSELEPKAVFSYFEDICSIPHGSGNTKMISDYLVEFAKSHNLKYRQDNLNNVVIWADATKGYENAPTVILQGHMDMVAVQDADVDKDMKREGLDVAIDGDWIYAKGTSLGGDDGIAVAYALAILDSDEIPHPALEVVITVDEETGMYGAAGLDPEGINGRILLNMDSEDDGIFLTSCAGGATVKCTFPLEFTEVDGKIYELNIKGLLGGHSGTEIIKGLANANILLGRYMTAINKINYSIGKINGGEKDNAIANSLSARIVVAEDDAILLEKYTREFEADIKAEYKGIEENISITVTPSDIHGAVGCFSDKCRDQVREFLFHIPYGVQAMMADMPEVVQTSSNLGIIKTTKDEIILTSSVRSCIGSKKKWLISRIKDLTIMLGGFVNVTGDYPAWEYTPDSYIRNLFSEIYEEITGQKATLLAIHAGVECGLLYEKLPGLDCVSYGPQMQDIHTTREKLNISSVKRNFELTCEVLRKIR